MKRPTDAFWKALQDIDQKLDETDYYALLGVSSDATHEDLSAAFERQVRAVHPDRHARETQPVRKEMLTRIYARVGEANRILSNPQQRSEYDRSLCTGALRYQDRRGSDAPTALDPKHPQARSLFAQATELLAQDLKKAARSKLQLAKQYQPDSSAITKALALCEEAPRTTERKPIAPTVPSPAKSVTDAPTAASPASSVTDAPTATSKKEGAPAMRMHKRAPLGKTIAVSCEAWKDTTNLYMQNISRGGMLLRCDEVVPIGSILELRLDGPSGTTIELPAEVMRHIPQQEGHRPAIGVRFLMIPESSAKAFESLLCSAGLKSSTKNEVPTIHSNVDDGIDDTIATARRLMSAGRASDAYELLRVIVREFPENKVLRSAYHLAAGLTARERKLDDAAHRHFERALRFAPDSELVLQYLREDAL